MQNGTRQRFNYDALILAGYGAMGTGFFKLGKNFLARFKEIVVMDARRLIRAGGPTRIIHGDVENTFFLNQVLGEYRQKGFLFVNLCAGTDNYRIRKVVAHNEGAYIDTACSMMYRKDEYRYSVLMPHTFLPTENKLPHFVCCGVNPGMVELMVRKVIYERFPGCKDFDIFFEYDRFKAEGVKEKIGVSWSPCTLIDEVMLSPTFQVKDGKDVEGEKGPTFSAKCFWDEKWIDTRLVGHEELWNLSRNPSLNIKNTCYAYSFRDEIMKLFAGDVTEAKAKLAIPGTDVKTVGLDTLAIKVVERSSGRNQTIVWETDHLACQEEWGINAVQFQVCSSLLVFCELLLNIDKWKEGDITCASSLPIETFGWEYLAKLKKMYGIHWEQADDLTLRIKMERGD